MNLLRLTYYQAPSYIEDQYEAERSYEIMGSPDAVWNTWFHFQQLENLRPAGAHPRFVRVFNLLGEEVDMTKGISYAMAKANVTGHK